MLIPCPICGGTGVLIKMTVPSIKAPQQQSKKEKVLCSECQGTGLIEAGYLAKKEGFIKD